MLIMTPATPETPSDALRGCVVALLEARRGEELADLIRRYGGEPRVVPALREEPCVDTTALRPLLDDLTSRGLAAAVFQTGVGVEYLFQAVRQLEEDVERRLRDLLTTTVVVARGPKPTTALKSLGVRVDRSVPTPYTTKELIASLEDIAVRDRAVLLAQHGGENPVLRDYLTGRGARVEELRLYRWELPERSDPLVDLLAAIRLGQVQAVVFTSASQVEHLCLVAEASGQRLALIEALRHGPVVAAVGPVCAQALRERGIEPADGILEPHQPKMVPLVRTLAAHMAQRR